MLQSYIFWGLKPDTALVIAGVHGSEMSGIEVANWMRVKLQAGQVPPTFTTIIIPEIFPAQARIGRAYRLKKNLNDTFDDTENPDVNGRYIQNGKESIEPNRQFPRPGEPLSSLQDKSAGGQTLLLETRELLQLIELTKPVRIASIHAHNVSSKPPRKGKDGPGIFVDPRYTFSDACLREFKKVGPYDVNLCKFDLAKDPAFPDIPAKKQYDSARDPESRTDDTLALHIAQELAATQPRLVPGNHLTDPPAVIHYAASSPPSVPGFSLGDWAPVTVGHEGDSNYRSGAPVITVEVFHQFESWAFIDGQQIYDQTGRLLPGKTPPLIPGTKKPYPFNQRRSTELQAYADALITTFLTDTSTK